MLPTNICVPFHFLNKIYRLYLILYENNQNYYMRLLLLIHDLN